MPSSDELRQRIQEALQYAGALRNLSESEEDYRKQVEELHKAGKDIGGTWDDINKKFQTSSQLLDETAAGWENYTEHLREQEQAALKVEAAQRGLNDIWAVGTTIIGGLNQALPKMTGALSVVGSTIARGAAGGVVTQFTAAQTAVSAVGSIVRSLPGPLGIVGGLITNVIGAGLQEAANQAERFRTVVNNTISEVTRGSMPMMRAIERTGIGIMETGIQRTLERTQEAGMGSMSHLTGLFGRGTAEAMIGVGVQNEVLALARRAQGMQENLRAALESREVRGILAGLHTRSAQEAAGFQAQDTREATTRIAGARTQALERGFSPEQARDAGRRMETVVNLARNLVGPGVDWATAMERANTALGSQLVQMTLADRLARQAVAHEQLAARTRQDRQVTNVGISQQIDFMRTQGQMGLQQVDMSRELAELQDQRRTGQIDEIHHAERVVQVMENARTQQGLINAQDVNSRMERNRRPLESFAFNLQRLNQLQPEFMARGRDITGATGAEQFQREQARLVEDMMRAAGPLERLAPVLEEGTAAAQSAISAAEREQRAGDPLTQMPALLRALNTQAESQNQWQQRAALALERIRPGEVRGVPGGAAPR